MVFRPSSMRGLDSATQLTTESKHGTCTQYGERSRNRIEFNGVNQVAGTTERGDRNEFKL
jgi:hypothetical protein